jgi:hypothetical protein
MTSLDLFLGPVYIFLIFVLAYAFRSSVTDKDSKKYYIPALSLKLVGAVALGVIYQFYYVSGDTYGYYQGATWVYEAFKHGIVVAFKIILQDNVFNPETYNYTSRIIYFRSDANFFICRIAGFFGMLSFCTYTAIAAFFAAVSFSGLFALYTTMKSIYPHLSKQLAIACLFVPSVVFWGSGLNKDTMTIGFLGWVFYGFHNLVIKRRAVTTSILALAIGIFVIYMVKIYIIMCFLPAMMMWGYTEYNARIKSTFFRWTARPVLLGVVIALGYFAIDKLSKDNERYSLDALAETASVTSNYLERQTQRKAGTEANRKGSGYSVGKLDGSWESMISAAPQALVVSLFRPFLWEVNNPMMVLSALESFAFLYMTVMLFFKLGVMATIRKIADTPFLSLCFIFSITFGIMVGLTAGNFGTLVRYKIPLMPFYAAALFILRDELRIKKELKLRQRRQVALA